MRAQWVGLVVRYRSLLLAIAATAVVLVGQLAEDLADGPVLQMLPPVAAIQRWTVIALVAYIFGTSAIVDRVVGRALSALRSIVRIDDAAFAAYSRTMRRVPAAVDATLLIAAAVAALLIFGVARSDLLMPDPVTHQSRQLPADPLAAVLIVAGYIVIGWSFLRLVYGTARLAWLLSRLTREPLLINTFDTAELIPFGNIALALALAPVGVIVILLVGLGSPTTIVAWTVLVAATVASVLALLLPLRGIHRQMSQAKYAALAALSVRIAEIYSAVVPTTPNDPMELARMSNAANILIQLRKATQEMTTWPFRDTVAFGRALLIASAPLIYTTLSELIKVFWINPLNQ
jgi:hypothetical protein